MICSNCHAQIDENATTCPMCGKKAEPAEDVICPKCGEFVGYFNKKCPKCGLEFSLSNDEYLDSLAKGNGKYSEEDVRKRKKVIKITKFYYYFWIVLVAVILLAVLILFIGGIF